jgi:hypothetical protein
MKNTSKKTIVIGLVLFSAVSFIVFGNVGNVADNETLRTQIRYNADEAGVVLTDVWSRVQSDRKMVILGGSLSSTQQLHTLFCSLTNFVNFITQVQQEITTPDGNPYPQFFSIGFDPYKKEKDKDEKKSVAEKSETNSVEVTEETKESSQKQKMTKEEQKIHKIKSSAKYHEATGPVENTD